VHEVTEPVRFTGPGGDYNLREFVQVLRLQDRPPKAVTAICKDAGISRANFYFLIGTEEKPSVQVPSLETLVPLLYALGATDVELPSAPEQPIRVHAATGIYTVTFRQDSVVDTTRERSKARASFATDAMESLVKGYELSRLVSSSTRFGAALPLGVALAATVIRLQTERLTQSIDDAATSKQAATMQVDLPDLREALSEASTEDIEAIIDALKAERDARVSGESD